MVIERCYLAPEPERALDQLGAQLDGAFARAPRAAVAGAGGVAVGARSPGPVGPAARLAELFERDQRLVVDLNDAQKRLRVGERELLEAGQVALLDTRLSSGPTASGAGKAADGWAVAA